MDYRHEKKYICSEAQLTVLKARLRPIMQPDSHDTDGLGYLVRTLYFDDVDDRFLKDNLYGFDDRVKYRIRTYNRSEQLIRLETKTKKHGLGKKESCPLSKDEFFDLLSGEALEFRADMEKPLRRLTVEMQAAMCRPRIIVEYERLAFVLPIGNVRITFDRNIVCSGELSRFFEDDLVRVPVLPAGQHVLEVKYDELLPSYLLRAMDIGELMQNTFSKYVMSRLALSE